MDAFEQLAADFFWADGYWVRTSVKVELTKEDKIRINKPSSPRWEIDLVAYKPSENKLMALECKSYLDSGGVHDAHFEVGAKLAGRYKLFHDGCLRSVVLDRLKAQCISAQLCLPDASVELGLIYAYATDFNEQKLVARFKEKNIPLFGREWLSRHVERMTVSSYENNSASIITKIINRSTNSINNDKLSLTSS